MDKYGDSFADNSTSAYHRITRPHALSSMSPTSRKQSPDNMKDSHNVLSMLQTIEAIYKACQAVLNSHSRSLLLLSLSLEAQMLIYKLRIMNKRWRHHLPFKEACTVDFFDWGKKIKSMSKSLSELDEGDDGEEKISEFCPSKHFMLDLYEYSQDQASALDYKPYYEETNIPIFLSRQDKILKSITAGWADYKERLSQAVIENQKPETVCHATTQLHGQRNEIQRSCSEMLQLLAEQLFKLYDILNGVFSRDQFARLTERIINESEYKCRKAEMAAKNYIANLKNTTPEEELPAVLQTEIQLSLDAIAKMKYGNSVSRYIGGSNYIEGHYSGFGRFLYSLRSEIDPEELKQIMEQLYRIHYIHAEIEQQEEVRRAEEAALEAQKAEDAAKLAEAAHQSGKTASETYAIRTAAKPRSPQLPSFFSSELAGNAEALKEYYRILHNIGFHTGRTLLPAEKTAPKTKHYAGWKWKHLRDALSEMHLIARSTTQKGLADYLADVFPYLNPDSVKRSFNNKGLNKEDPRISRRIVADIIDEFSPVMKILSLK